jgi:hypothetical protein
MVQKIINTLFMVFYIITSRSDPTQKVLLADHIYWLTDFHKVNPKVSESARLIPQNIDPDDQFGFSTAISGEMLVIGSPGASPAAQSSGAVYIFEPDQTIINSGWSQIAMLTPADPAVFDQFGWSVAIDGDTLAVGAYTKLPGGAVYIFERDEGGQDNWGQVAKVVGLDTYYGDGFGVDVDICGDFLVVGMYAGGDYAGSIYVFERDFGGTNAWGQIAHLFSSDNSPYDYFGYSLDIEGETIIAGAPGNNGLTGAAYVFQPDGEESGNWIETEQLIASDADLQNYFGLDLSFSGDIVVIGALGHRDFAGTAYLFEYHPDRPDQWQQIAIISESDANPGDRFGGAVSIFGDKLIVGAYGEYEFTGAATLYFRSVDQPGLWQERAHIVAKDGIPGNSFGNSVCVEESEALVGAVGYFPGGAAYVYSLENSSPEIISLQLSENPIHANMPLAISSTILDLDIDETLTASIEWGDGYTETLYAQGSPITYTINATHTYDDGSMFYTILLDVYDLAGASDQITTTVMVLENPHLYYLPYIINQE